MKIIRPPYKITGPWVLEDIKLIKRNGLKVFSCFHCGGGSTMGYKLAGFDVLGGVEIDPKMMAIYKKNHNPKHSFLMGVQEFKNLPDDQIPKELFELDILDGSPPCSSFSMAGSREKAWGDKKKFREGQVDQVLDTLFFDFIDIAARLKPKVVVAENVKGLIQGNARGYVKDIFKAFKEAGYSTQLFVLNSSRMGVPQRRERTFFVANQLNKSVKLDFEEPLIPLREAFVGINHNHEHSKLSEKSLGLWKKCRPGQSLSTVHEKGHYFNWSREDWRKPCRTITATNGVSGAFHPEEPRPFCRIELCRIQSFPDDYNFLDEKPGYVTGMSVPPFMTQRLAMEIEKQLLS